MTNIGDTQPAITRADTPASARAILFPFVFDYVAYGIALSAISMATFFPMFVRSLTSSTIVIGLIPAIQVLGRALGPLFAAHWLERQRRLKYWVIACMMVERTPIILVGAFILASGERAPHALLVGVLALWACYSLANGWSSATWNNLVARVVPPNLRGRMSGWGGGVSSLTGIAVVALMRYLFGALGLRMGYGLGFAAAGVIMVTSSFVFLTTRERAQETPVHNMSLGAYLGGLPGVLRSDRRFAWFLLARGLWTLGATASSFYTVYAMGRFGAGPSEVAWLAVAMSLGSMAGSFLGGFLADAAGNKVVLVVSCGLLVVAAGLALVGSNMLLLLGVFALNGMGQNTGMLSGQNMPLELAREGRVATYLAINGVMLGPLSALAPVAAGALVGFAGYTLLFALCAVTALLGGLVLLWRVAEPRKRPNPGRLTA